MILQHVNSYDPLHHQHHDSPPWLHELYHKQRREKSLRRKKSLKLDIVLSVKTFGGLVLAGWEGFCGMGDEDLVDGVDVVDSCGNTSLEDYVIKQEFRKRVSGGI